MSTQSIHNIQITCPYTKSMKIQSRHKTPSSLYLYSPYLSPPMATKHQKKGDLVLSWRRWGLQAGSGGELSGRVIGVVVRPVVVDRRGLLLDRGRRNNISRWCSGRSWLGDDRGIRQRSRCDGRQVWLSGAHDGRTEHLRL